MDDGHQAKAIGLAPANALAQQGLEGLRVRHLQNALVGHSQQGNRLGAVFLEVIGLLPGHCERPLRDGKAVLCGLRPQPFLLLHLEIAGFQGSPGRMVGRVFFAAGGVGSQAELPAAARCHPFQQRVIRPGLRWRTGAELRTQGGQVRPFLTEQEQVQFFSQPIQPPQPAAARTGKSVFHRTMEFLGRDQRHHGLTAGRVKFCAG